MSVYEIIAANRCIPALARWLLSRRLRDHLLYFDNVKTGMLSIVRPQNAESVEYLRFSVVQRSERTARS